MNKKFWLIIFIIAILAGILFGYLQNKFSGPPSLKEKIESSGRESQKEKNIETIPLEKPPFIKD